VLDVQFGGDLVGAMLVAVVAHLVRRDVPSDVAIVGEIGLQGTFVGYSVRPGGAGAEVLAARADGVRKLILPKYSQQTPQDVAPSNAVMAAVEVVAVKNAMAVLEAVWPPPSSEGATVTPLLASGGVPEEKGAET
jgi:ATP-dependent Lon protease